MSLRLVLVVVVLCGLLLAVSATRGRAEVGIASLYNLSGRVACKPYPWLDSRALTAAHRTLPCGTRVRVHRGKRHVDVVVNDRGPFIPGRVIDLTLAAGRRINLDLTQGIALVRLEVLR